MPRTNNPDDFFNELDRISGSSARLHRSVKTNNGVATTYKVLLAIALVVAGCILLFGCILYPINNRGGNAETVAFCWGIFLGLLSTSLVGLAIAEVIQILHDIRAKLYEEKKDGSKK